MAENFCYRGFPDVLTRSGMPIEKNVFVERIFAAQSKYLRIGESVYLFPFIINGTLPSHSLLVPRDGLTEINRLQRDDPEELDAGYVGIKVSFQSGLWRIVLSDNSSDLKLPIKSVARLAKQRTLEVIQGVDPQIEVALM